MVVLAPIFSKLYHLAAAESELAVINPIISTAEDGPQISAATKFLPGDYVYVRFELAGFAIQTAGDGQASKISLQYRVVPEDKQKRPLAEAVSDEIVTELSPEDKNWVPKRRVSFLLPSFLAAGTYHLQLSVHDVFGRKDATREVPFEIGGVTVNEAGSITIENFHFFRSENDTEPLEVAAFSAGDTIYARFDLMGFGHTSDNGHHVAYGVTVLDPNGKAFIQDPHAADLNSTAFYPAQFVPGNLALKLAKSSIRGKYTVLLKARDLVAGQEYEVKKMFDIE